MFSWLKLFFRRRKHLPPLEFEPGFLESDTTLEDAVTVVIRPLETAADGYS